MRNELKQAIKHKSLKLIKKQAAKEKKAAEYAFKFQKRTGLAAGVVKAPKPFSLHRHFDPDHCRRKAAFIAGGIWSKAVSQKYFPVPAVLHRIDKPGTNQKREIMEFAIPDAAFANVINKRLLARNIKRYSGNSFAYRYDRNQFDAIINLKQWLKNDKIYVIQFDFKKYFDNIPHTYIDRILNQRELISISSIERELVDKFLRHEYSLRKLYGTGPHSKKEYLGTPQGSSLSLFLANLANDALDKRLEIVNGQFVRYADDVVAIANSYEDAIRIEKCFYDHCRDSGLQINIDKSDGIRLLSYKKSNEIASIESFRFLGYDFYDDGCSISSKSISRIKQKISKLIHIYLHRYPEKFGFSLKRTLSSTALPFYDWDLMGLVSELRNYLYGGCSENDLQSLLFKGKKPPPMRGLMSFYALVDDKASLQDLDGWLVNTIRRALVRRKYALAGYGVDYPKFSNGTLILGTWYDPSFSESGKFEPDPRLPSFVRGWRAARKYYLTFGLNDASPPPYSGY